MKNFKFLSKNDENQISYLDEDSPSWIYESHVILPNVPYEVISSDCRGILEFLSMFPNRSIQTVRRISGVCVADGNIRVHDGTTDYLDGWGFDIREDLILVEWLKFNPE
jgi:hypothetical protein